MKYKNSIGIVAYGVALPAQHVAAELIEENQGKVGDGVAKSLGMVHKTVPDLDEDSATLATAAAMQALSRWSGDQSEIEALFIGSESHPYAVKPTGTIVKQALGLGESMALADLQFACKAGTQSLQVVSSYVSAGLIKAGLAIGADTAQARPGDVLEFTAGAGAAAYVCGTQKILAKFLGTVSVATETPDFWRRPGQKYPEHAGRFSGEPGYFYHVKSASQKMMAELNLEPSDFAFCVFHTPNAKFPKLVAKQLGFSDDQLKPSLVVPEVGNTYAAASLLALAATLDQAEAGQKILVTSYGSGAGADSFVLETTDELVKQRKNWQHLTREQVAATQPLSYHEYQNLTSQNGGH